MKPFLAILLSLTLLPIPTGCKAASTSTAPQSLAPGYMNSADQAMGETLVGAHNFYSTLQGDIASGKYVPSATEKTALNNFASALNVAQEIYIGYHNGVNTQVQAQSAVNTVVTQQTAIQATVGAK